VLRRLDCVLENTKADVLKELEVRTKAKLNPEPFLLRKSGQLFYNSSPLDMKKLMDDQDHIKENLYAYVQGFSSAVREIFVWWSGLCRCCQPNLLRSDLRSAIDYRRAVDSSSQPSSKPSLIFSPVLLEPGYRGVGSDIVRLLSAHHCLSAAYVASFWKLYHLSKSSVLSM
jgi:hypothetical protein